MTCSQEKDILPLPSPPVQTRQRSGLSRGCAQRHGFRRYADQGVRDCVESTNCSAGLHNSPVDSDVSELQHRSIEGIRGAVRERTVGGRSQTFSKHEAVSALLRGGGMVRTPWTLPLVAWPCTTPRVSLAQLLWGNAREFVCRWSELMLNSENEQKLVDATSEPPRLYQYPKLAGSRMAYTSFIRTLFGKELVGFSRTPKFHCACFSVHEKQVRQRLIVDAREVNRHFKRLPSVALARPEALAGLDCNASSRFWISTVDVRDAFHRMARRPV